MQLTVGSLGSEYNISHLGGDRHHIASCQNLNASALRYESVSSVKAAVLGRAVDAGLLCRHGGCCVGVGRVPTQAAPHDVGIQIWLARGHDLAVEEEGHWVPSPMANISSLE